MQLTPVLALTMLGLTGVLAQEPPALPAFEVASIRENVSGDPRTQFELPGGGRFVVVNATLREIVRVAHDVQDFTLVDAPDWTKTTRFDIAARADRDITLTTLNSVGGRPVVFLMMQTLLADRFKFMAHRETREMPVYALVMARSDKKPGPRLIVSTTDCDAVLAAARDKSKPPGASPGADQLPICGARFRQGRIAAGSMPIANLALSLSSITGRVVLDRTGLAGRFDFVVDYVAAPSPDSDVAPLPAALEEQLGLKLDSIKAPVDVLVVDRIERPTQN